DRPTPHGSTMSTNTTVPKPFPSKMLLSAETTREIEADSAASQPVGCEQGQEPGDPLSGPSQGIPSDLARDIIAAAQMVRDRHNGLFIADRRLKDRAARLFRTMLPPRPRRPGRKKIASVTLAIRLLRKLRREHPTLTPEQIWAKVYPKVIPN